MTKTEGKLFFDGIKQIIKISRVNIWSMYIFSDRFKQENLPRCTISLAWTSLTWAFTEKELKHYKYTNIDILGSFQAKVLIITFE